MFIFLKDSVLIRYQRVLTFLFSVHELFRKEINVKRSNTLKSNDYLKLVISNNERQHSGVINGKPLPEREGQVDLMFLNSVSYECGGVFHDGNN